MEIEAHQQLFPAGGERSCLVCTTEVEMCGWPGMVGGQEARGEGKIRGTFCL